MGSYVVLVSLMVSFTFAEVGIMRAKVGSRVVLSLGENVTKWMRVKDDGTKETVRYCGRRKTGPGCDQFINVKRKATAVPKSKVQVFPNGTLVFKKIRGSDGGTYYSPQSKPKVRGLS
ncbi:hypothetical protein ANCDUO_08112 [Ancylostoma duodenale]|uniref:Uncharacterized protein n=1 Tax=Ancylostoma duodenale TaxID=51022 RepID=A0A0C2GWU5_9BILA|nr:hypothetical protein ANCDUO_08112 [Ancylostoma duodenale]